MFSWVSSPQAIRNAGREVSTLCAKWKGLFVAAGIQNPTEASAQARLPRPDYPMGTKLISTDKLASRQRLIAHLLTRFSLLSGLSANKLFSMSARVGPVPVNREPEMAADG
jgi:hypothetical protein